ncbi:hypothetical protein [Salinisphaera sp. G21_0]|uniref:hypothetical protein n=1 Tax=Salinisphaera sp. G21_0 TaxID=2821094 RepID=UPI001ADCF5A3|nr:hypothetical protein [Salinisphaera sp. G21_0]
MSYANMKNNIFPNWLRQRYAFIFIVSFFAVMLAGCQTNGKMFPELKQEKLTKDNNWTVLPFISHAKVPAEDLIQLERMLLVQLPSKGIKNPTIYHLPKTFSVPDYLSEVFQVEQARVWAISQHIKYSISAEILEWQYDQQNRFSTTLSLKVNDLSSGDLVWSIDGLGEGRPGEAAYDVSRKLIADLVAAMPLQ